MMVQWLDEGVLPILSIQPVHSDLICSHQITWNILPNIMANLLSSRFYINSHEVKYLLIVHLSQTRDIKAVNNQVETRRARAIYLISILPSVYSKSWSQDESQEEPVFLLSVAPPQRAADSLTYWSFTNTGKTTLLL